MAAEDASDAAAAAGCVFCAIVAGAEGSRVLYRDDRVVCFADFTPRAAGHYQVVPVVHHDSCDTVTETERSLIEHMHAVGRKVVEEEHGTGRKAVFGFHVPPFTSVNHLHMHCLYPPYKGLFRLKYLPAFPWFRTVATALAGLGQEK